jgi:FAD/FMN-containing dehydrogenase
VQQALALLREVRALWQGWLDVVQADGRRSLFDQLQDHSLRASWKHADPQAAAAAVRRRRLRPSSTSASASTSEVLRGRVWVALHMHAGDGNVHTNIPVNSDNYEMLQTAHEAVARIMALARSLDGVISGEHGIGITKLEFLTDDETGALRRLQGAHRPRRPLQQGQAAARRRARAAGPRAKPCRPERTPTRPASG